MTGQPQRKTVRAALAGLLAKRAGARDGSQGRARGRLIMMGFLLCFAIISGRIIQLAVFAPQVDRTTTASIAQSRSL